MPFAARSRANRFSGSEMPRLRQLLGFPWMTTGRRTVNCELSRGIAVESKNLWDRQDSCTKNARRNLF